MPDDAPETPPIAHKWQPIEDLPENWRGLCRPDLHAVQRQWAADRKLIKDPTKIAEFQDRLYTLWAIETGIIERLYTVDRGVTVALLEAGMDALEQLHTEGQVTTDARALIEDQHAALQFVMNLVGGSRELTSSYIRELHQGLTRRQEHSVAEDQFGRVMKVPLLRGDWKKQPNNPKQPDGSIHEYCPPEQVQSEVDEFLAWRERHESLNVCPEVEAAWLHHRFTQIHPFQDGNGRVARALTSAVFLKADYLVLVVRDEEHRERYLDALEAADKGDLKPLVDLFADIQRSDLREALKTIRLLRGEESVRAIEAAASAARQSQDATTARVAGALDELIGVASVRLEEVVAETQRAFESQDVVVAASVSKGDASEVSWSWHIADAAKMQGYPVDLERPQRWASLRLGLPARAETDIRLVISLYGTGRQPRRYAALAVVTRPSGDGAWERRVTLGEAFVFDVQSSTDEAIEGVAAKFRVWLDEKITSGIRTWSYDL